MRISDWSSDVCSSDLRKLTELSTTLGVGLLQAGMLLVTFIGILWALSDNIVFNFNGSSFAIPGYMVWCAILYALIGSLLTWRVGLPLRSEEHTSELQSLMRISYAVFCLKKKTDDTNTKPITNRLNK